METMRKPEESKGRVEFKSPWGVALWIVTSLTLLLFGSVAVLGIVGVFTDDPDAPLFVTLPCVVLVALVAYGYFIRGFTVTSEAVIVRRFARDIVFSLSDLHSIELDPAAMRWTCPMPNGGLFSFGGAGCRNRKLGKYIAYATDFKRCVVLRFANITVVVTPDDPKAFINAVIKDHPTVKPE